MINNYRVFNLSCEAGENLVTKIYNVLKNEGYRMPNFRLQFIGFEIVPLMQFKLNDKLMVVPSSGQFISPYDGNEYLPIKSVVFDEDVYNIDFYCIY